MIISHYFLQIFTIYYFHFHDVMIQLIHFHLYFPVHCSACLYVSKHMNNKNSITFNNTVVYPTAMNGLFQSSG